MKPPLSPVQELAELDGGTIEDSVAAEPSGELLDGYDRKILTIIQSAFPLEPHPYEVIGQQVGLAGAEVLERVRGMRERKIIRRLGANFQSAKLGFRSTLCAAKVPAEKMDAFIQDVNSHTEVTHNYLRNHTYNMWFTCIGPSWQAVCQLLDGITARTGIPVLNLPAEKTYKIKVDFNLTE